MRKPAQTDPAETVLAEVARLAGSDSGVSPETLGSFLGRVIAAVSSRRRLTEADLRECGARGAEAARAGVAVGAVVDLYLSSVWRLWPQLPGLMGSGQAERHTLSDQALFALRAADDGVAALVEGYDQQLRSMVSTEAAAQQEFLDDLLAGQVDAAALVERGLQLGLRLGGPHRVVVVRGLPPARRTGQRTISVNRSITALAGDSGTILAAKGQDLVAVLPDAGPSRGSLGEPELTLLVGKLLVALGVRDAARSRVRAGVGRCLPGPRGARASWLEAQEAVEVAEQLGLTTPVVTADRVGAHRLLARDPASLTQLVESVLGPLRGVRGGAEPLIDTLITHLATDSTAETARQLHLSVRATTYRLDRITTLTGRSVRDPVDRYALHTAALGARLLGWPSALVAESRQ